MWIWSLLNEMNQLDFILIAKSCIRNITKKTALIMSFYANCVKLFKSVNYYYFYLLIIQKSGSGNYIYVHYCKLCNFDSVLIYVFI